MSEQARDQLPHLLTLLHDESTFIRDSVLSKLAEYGPTLKADLRMLPHPLSERHICELLEEIESHQAQVQKFYTQSPSGTVLRTALFQPGDRVLHRRYGYRGLIVERDLQCQASNEWYDRNQSQPDRDQPWYHVLVHGSTGVTYAAQTSLLPEDSSETIHHVLVPHFFEANEDGHYVRNTNEWPRE